MPPLRAGSYHRNSSAEDASLERQAAANLAAAARYGWDTVVYEDPVSASRYSRQPRPDWDQLLADVKAGHLDIVLLWESSRGDRKLAEWAAFLDLCRETGMHIYVTTHDHIYDMSKARDWRALAEDGIDSAYESEKISMRSRDGVGRAAAKGIPHGRIPYGYTRTYERIPGRVKPMPHQVENPEEATVVREVVQRIAASESISAILRDFERRGVRTRAGMPWARSSLCRLVLEGTVYLGKRRHKSAPLQDGDWPALVEPTVFWQANAVLRDPARKAQADARGGIRPGRAKWFLSYIAVCDTCEKPLWVKFRGPRKEPYYGCSGRGCAYAPVDWFDSQVTDMVLAWLARPGIYEALTAPDDEAVIAAQAEAESERSRLDDLRQKVIDNKLDADDFVVLASGIKARIAELDERASALAVPPVVRDLLTPQSVSRITDLRVRWDGMPVSARRDVVRTLFELRLTPTSGDLLDPNRIHITWPEYRWGLVTGR